MNEASIETTLELWASELREVKARIRPLFTQERVAASAGLFLEVLLGSKRRNTGRMRAEAAGDPGPWRQQAFLNRHRWEADALRDLVRDYALETLADAGAVLMIEEAGFLKQGRSSCGVARQHTEPAGRVANCQVGVFLAYESRHGHAFIDRALYLPKSWTDDPARLAAAHVPPETGFATKPQLALRMIERATAAGVPFAWVAADSPYGAAALETALRRAGKGYVLGVSAASQFSSRSGKPEVAGTAEAIAQGLDPSAWRRLPAEGGRGARLYDWAYVELADLKPEQFGGNSPGLWTRGLLIRRGVADGGRAFFTTWCPAGTGIEALVAVEERRRTVRDSLEAAKAELGLDHNGTRSWHGWHRHVSLVMLAFAVVATVHHHANQLTPKAPRTARRRSPSSAGRSAEAVALARALHSDASGPHTPSPAGACRLERKPPSSRPQAEWPASGATDSRGHD